MTSPQQSAAVIAAGLAAFVGVGWFLDSSAQLDETRTALQSKSELSSELNSGLLSGRLGARLREAEIIEPLPEDAEGKRKAPPSGLAVKQGIHQRLVSLDLVKPLRSTTQVLPEHFSDGIPTLSLWVDEDDLNSPERGIIPNWTEKWERDAEVSYFEDGKLRFTTKCGVRLHGGTTRNGDIMRQRGSDWRSFRLRFRKRYGLEAVPPGVMLPEEAGPIVALTLRGNYFLPQAVGFEIARKLDLVVPETRMARFVLNGKAWQTYSLIDHTGRRQFEARLGHDNFKLANVFLPDRKDDQPYIELLKKVLKFDSERIREEAEALIDIDDYMRHMFTLLYCAPADWGEGSCFINLNDENPRWRWILWDLDNAFKVVNAHTIKEGDIEPWQKGFLDLVLKPFPKADSQARTYLFQRLVAEDPTFPHDFAHEVQDILNHEATDVFVWKVVQRMRPFHLWEKSESRRKKSLRREHPIQAFARHRPKVIRTDLSNQFDLGPAQKIIVRGAGEEVQVPPASSSTVIRIDGRDTHLPYTGWYFPEFPIELQPPDAAAKSFSHWLVDGERVDGASFPSDKVPAGSKEVVIEAVFER